MIGFNESFSGLNREERRCAIKLHNDHVRKLPAELTPIPPAEFPNDTILLAWRSRNYLVQLIQDDKHQRLSINRSTRGPDGRFIDGLTWDELQQIKHDVGFGNFECIEIYPRDCDVVNVSNMRHLWLLEKPLPFGWKRS